MGWKDSKADAANRGGFVSLKDDGDTVDFIALTEPETTEKDGFKGGEKRTVYRVQAVVVPVQKGCNALALDLTIFSFNSYAVTPGQGHELKSVIRMTRSGVKGDLATRYSFGIVRKAKPSEVKEAKRALKDATVPF